MIRSGSKLSACSSILYASLTIRSCKLKTTQTKQKILNVHSCVKMNPIHVFLTVLNCYFVTSEMSTCSQRQMQDAWMRTMSEDIKCRPRPTIIPVTVTSPHHTIMSPTHVQVNRCSGSCPQAHSSYHSCVPGKVSAKEVPVMLSPLSITPGVQDTVCSSVTVEEHDTCTCGCHVSPRDCHGKQHYIAHMCQCSCDHAEKAECTARGWDWDSNLCLCKCPGSPYPTCPTGYYFDYLENCQCLPKWMAALPALEIVFVVVLLGFFCILLSLCQCYRRRSGLFKHLRSGIYI